MLNYTLLQRAHILASPGCVKEIANVLKDGKFKKPLIIYDQGVKMCGIVDTVTGILKKAGMEYAEYGDVLPDPPSTVVAAATKIHKDNKCDCILAIGGGSSIDTGKGVSVEIHNPGHTILDFADMNLEMNYCPGLITIPTTAGTGAELSNGIIITNLDTNVKVPIVGNKAMAEYVLLDAELTVGMPLGLTLMTGLDVLSHAMEAYTTNLAGPMTDIVCEKLITEVVENLPRVVKDPKDIYSRQRMLLCASMGGWMLANCCANIGHSIAHTIGAKFHVPHGACCAFSAPVMLRFNAVALPEKYRKIGILLGAKFDGKESPEEIGDKTAKAYIKFRDSLGLKPITEFGVKKEEAVKLAHDVTVETFAMFNPRKVTDKDSEKLLAELFD